MESYINAIAQILFAAAIIMFVAYSIVGIYTLNTYGRSKSVSLSITAIYVCIMITLMSWAWLAVSLE